MIDQLNKKAETDLHNTQQLIRSAEIRIDENKRIIKNLEEKKYEEEVILHKLTRVYEMKKGNQLFRLRIKEIFLRSRKQEMIDQGISSSTPVMIRVSRQIDEVASAIRTKESHGVRSHPNYNIMTYADLSNEKTRLEKLIERRELFASGDFILVRDECYVNQHLTKLEYNRIALRIVKNEISKRFPHMSGEQTQITGSRRPRDEDDTGDVEREVQCARQE